MSDYSGSVSRPSPNVSPRQTRPSRPAPLERRWEKITPDVRDQLKTALKAMVDPDSYWSVVTAGCVTLLLSCLLLVWARPSVVLQKNPDGSVEQSRVSITRLFATAAFLTLVVVGIALYVKWRRGKPDIS
jgi:hypothetical protein